MARSCLSRAAVAAAATAALTAASLSGFAALQDEPSAGAAPPILVSRQLLRELGRNVGDTIRLSADESGAGARPFRIVGQYEPTPDPMRFAAVRHEARLHLPDLVALTPDASDPGAAEAVSAINVALVDAEDAPAFARDLEARMPGLNARPTARYGAAVNTFVVLERFHLAIAIVTVMGSTMFLLALMVMLADERRETVGTLRLLGLTRHRVLLQVFVEGLLIAMAGAVFGVLLAIVLQGGFNRFFQWRYDTTLVFVRVSPQVVWQSLALAVPLGVLAAVTASWALLRRHVLALVRR